MAHIGHYLAQSVSQLQNKVLTVCLERTRSTNEVYTEVAALSEALRGPLGLSAGDRVGLIARATDDFFQASLTAACKLDHLRMPHMRSPSWGGMAAVPGHLSFCSTSSISKLYLQML
jgi:acyl-CoA synthetase (AMP-forming)/AMP-acid ligase II